jgi:hypothetical protein
LCRRDGHGERQSICWSDRHLVNDKQSVSYTSVNYDC